MGCTAEQHRPFLASQRTTTACKAQPLMTASGFKRTTGRARSARSVRAMTSSTSLYASGASSARTFGVDAWIRMPFASNSSLSALPSMVFFAFVL